jgi:Mg-chelatase subunit ChlD
VAHRRAARQALVVAAILSATGCLAAPRVAAAQQDSAAVASLRLSQAHATQPTMVVYVDARRDDGRPALGLRANQLAATVGSQIVPVTGVHPFDSAGAGVGYIFLVDVSKSLPPSQFAEVKTAMRSWVTSLAPGDRGAVLTVGDSVRVVTDFTADRDTLAAAVDPLQLSDNQTRLFEGLTRAAEIGRTVDPQLPARRVIVVLSDGLDDVFGGMSEAEVLERLRTDHVPIYAIGLYRPPRTKEKEQGLRVLGNLARASGGALERVDARPLAEIYDAMRRRTREVLAVDISCQQCPWDGGLHRLQITARVGTRVLTDGLDVRLLPEPTPAPPPPAPVTSPRWAPVAGLAAAALLALLAGWALYRKRRRKPEPEAPQLGGPDLERVPAQEAAGAANVTGAPQIRLTPIGINAPGEARMFTVENRILVGRSPSETDFSLPDDEEISSVHCALVWEDPAIILRDLGSTNGTSVNGVPIRTEHRVEHDDVIGIGRSELRLSVLGHQP